MFWKDSETGTRDGNWLVMIKQCRAHLHLAASKVTRMLEKSEAGLQGSRPPARRAGLDWLAGNF